MTKILEKHRKIIAVLVAWTTLHLGLWISSPGTYYEQKSEFWPFGGNTSYYVPPNDSFDLKYYDGSEFFFYVIVLWVGFGIYLFLKEKQSEKTNR